MKNNIDMNKFLLPTTPNETPKQPMLTTKDTTMSLFVIN